MYMEEWVDMAELGWVGAHCRGTIGQGGARGGKWIMVTLEEQVNMAGEAAIIAGEEMVIRCTRSGVGYGEANFRFVNGQCHFYSQCHFQKRSMPFLINIQ